MARACLGVWTDRTRRPGGLGRQQSWDMRDMKRAHHENMFAGQSAAGGHGYTSTAGAQQ